MSPGQKPNDDLHLFLIQTVLRESQFVGRCQSEKGSLSIPVDADDHLIKAADFSLTSACPMNGLVTSRSALRQQAGQIAVGGNKQAALKKIYRQPFWAHPLHQPLPATC
jgi:hypothetical protein